MKCYVKTRTRKVRMMYTTNIVRFKQENCYRISTKIKYNQMIKIYPGREVVEKNLSDF